MILIASAVFPPEPVVSANISFDLANELSERYEVVVLSPKPTRPFGMSFTEKVAFSSFQHYVLPSYTHPQSNVFGRLWESYSFGQFLSKYIEEKHNSIEVVYANVWPLFSQLALSRACKKHGIPLVSHVQDIYPESLTKKIPLIGKFVNKVFLPIDKYVLRNSDAVVSISNQMREKLISSRNVNTEKVQVIRNWQDDSKFISNDLLESDKTPFTFLYLGSISPSAGVELLINAFVKASLSGARLVIAGNGSDKANCIKIASRYKATDIQFIEALPAQVPKIQAKADVLLLPLKRGIAETALPSKLTAYMFSSKPIIASVDQPSEVANVVKENSCGWVVNAEDLTGLAETMKASFYTDKKILSEMGRCALAYAKVNLSREVNLVKLSGLLEKHRRPV